MAQAVVPSANVVGYTKVSLKSGSAGVFNLVGLNFEAVGGGKIDLQDLVPGATVGLVRGTSYLNADNIQLWNFDLGRYDTYFLHNGSGLNNAPKANKWVESVTGAPIATGLVVRPGQGFFYSNNSSPSAKLELVAIPTYDLDLD